MTHTTHCCPPSNHTFDLSSTRITILQRLKKMYTVSLQRRELSFLDEHSLKDMGITAQQAAEESSRPFWDVS